MLALGKTGEGAYSRRHKNGDISVPCKQKRILFPCSWKWWMAFNKTRIEWKRNGIMYVRTLYWHVTICISGTHVRLLTSLEANSSRSSGRLHVSDRHWPSRVVSSTAWSSKNAVSITEAKAISLAVCKVGPAFLKLNFCFSILMTSMGAAWALTRYAC